MMLIEVIKRITINFIIVASLVSAFSVNAESQLKINLDVLPLSEGEVSDGTVIARGTILNFGGYSGVQLWMDAPKYDGNTDGYILYGQNNWAHKLHVSLRLTEGRAEALYGRFVIINITNRRTNFEIVADGQQNVFPDDYKLTVLSRGVSKEN